VYDQAVTTTEHDHAQKENSSRHPDEKIRVHHSHSSSCPKHKTDDPGDAKTATECRVTTPAVGQNLAKHG
jgi:hypothetical protein